MDILLRSLSDLFTVSNKGKVQITRNLLLFYMLLFFTTLIYLIIDTHVIHLPDPIIVYSFYILGFTILFGVRPAILASVFSILLVEYFLYEPRYTLSTFHHPVNILYLLFVILLGMILGQYIRQYQQKLRKHSEELDLLIKARDQFSAIAVHELKTPLTTISLYSQLLSKQYNNKEASKILQDSVQTITRETGKLNYMINDLLDFSRFQNNKFNMNVEVFDIVELCNERVKIAGSLFPDHIYIFNQRTKNGTILADSVAIDRVITNLLTNAGKYSAVKSKVIVSLSKKNKKFILSVKDHGKGIDKVHLDKLFEPFYQVDSGKKGLGLGLFITKSIIEFHNGTISVESKSGKGSTFFVSLPIKFQKSS